MSLATEPIYQLTQEQQQTYFMLADTALQQYGLDSATTTFVQHNAGIVFRITTKAKQYLLKLYKRVGDGNDPSAEQLEPGLEWLAALAQTSDVVVQIPIKTRRGQFVGQVSLASTATPISCTLQQWVEGNAPNGDFTLGHAQQLGTLLAKLHNFSRTYPLTNNQPAMYHNTQALADTIQLLRTALDATILPPQDFEIVAAAGKRIAENMAELGTSANVWGPVHGDLHYDNVVLYNTEIRPIDFTGLRLAHYLYDIGVTLYHTFHQGVALRQAFFAGYEQLGKLPFATVQKI